jgi:hypothetical protein
MLRKTWQVKESIKGTKAGCARNPEFLGEVESPLL